jgi:MEDS: MEthanogen/methylotroph, DcmR Sensory domain
MTAAGPAPAAHFRHEAFLYAGADDFVDRATPIVLRAVSAEEPVLIAIDSAKIELLRDRLGSASRAVAWKDIRGIGANPARIIPLWRQFVDGSATHHRLWGFGEPIWQGRAPAELVEAQRHEQLLNLAFADAPNFTLLCPYDTERLGAEVVREAHRSHPLIAESGSERTSVDYPGLAAISAADLPALPEPAEEPAEFAIGARDAGARNFLAHRGFAARLGAARTDDLTLAIVAVADGMGRPGGQRVVRVWEEPGAVVAEVRDLRAADDPLAGREWPPPAERAARGLWLANQLCDLVQVRPFGTGAIARLHVTTAI